MIGLATPRAFLCLCGLLLLTNPNLGYKPIADRATPGSIQPTAIHIPKFLISCCHLAAVSSSNKTVATNLIDFFFSVLEKFASFNFLEKKN
ncbi:hypothetical protein Pint_24704 [Pistacia integerrima]|uniref:Uncharacterized protein n=1 Tax=Pistacia integerrima TaxID=434235 RepID=A0ACC0YDP0_9ROSI|nr:hypothetical protein Pint_24704 [Pistacia integerrima]